MTIKDNQPDQAADLSADLRQKAETAFRENVAQSPENLESLSPEETQRLLHELRVHQIELEMQNEELRRSHRELDTARARYFDLYDLAPVGYVTVSETGLILEANLTAATLLGVARSNLVKLPLSEYILREDQDTYYLRRKKLLKTGNPQAFELRLVKKDGTAFWAHLAATAAQDPSTRPGQDGAGQPVVRVVLSDITERKRTEKTIGLLNRRHELILQSAGEGISGLDLDGNITFINTAATTMIGWEAREIIGRSQHDILHHSKLDGTPYPREDCPIYAAYRDGRVHSVADEMFWKKDGTSFPVEYTSTPVVEDGKLVGAVTVFRDITERKRAEDQIRTLNTELEQRVCERTSQLEVANKELEAFSYSVSHDLRAPLRAIEGFLGMVIEDYGGKLDAEVQRLLGVVRANATKMSRLIDDLLSFSRTGRSELKHDRLEMGLMARSAFAEIVPTPEVRAKIDFTVGELPEVEGDAALVRQVWVNLLSNAVKFSSRKERSVIEVAGALDGNQVVYRVRDNGAGFDMQYAGKLFGVFQRLHTPDQFEGTGVGLALVQRIVIRHGGRVWAEGEVGKGATFFFTLPARIENQS